MSHTFTLVRTSSSFLLEYILKYILIILLILAGLFYYTYKIISTSNHKSITEVDTAVSLLDSGFQKTDSVNQQNTITPWPDTIPLDEIVSFAETLQGIPYLYASTDPTKGFDCSGFITYVFNHFGLEVPRSSIDFTDKGTAIPFQQAQRGDLILFTATDSASTVVRHIGIVTENTDSLRFIHSSSGKANGVTITALNSYYQARLVKVISITKGL